MFDEAPQSILPPDISPAPRALRTFDELIRAHRLRCFGGDLHNHTSYSDGTGTPDQALARMRARGLDFAAITDHGEDLDRESRERAFDGWNSVAHHVRDASDESFLAIRGFEWSSDVQGHCNVLSSADYTSWRRTGDESMQSFYAWLVRARSNDADLVCGFNHPASVARPFDDYAPASGYTDARVLDDLFVTAECFNRERDHAAGFFRLLDSGWHVGAAGGSDHHGSEWGADDLPRTYVLARALTHEGVRDSLRARRTFATRIAGLRLALTADDGLMGARLAIRTGASVSFAIYVDDPQARATHVADAQLDRVSSYDVTGAVRHHANATSIELISNGGEIIAQALCEESTSGVWHHEIIPQVEEGERWFVARVMRGSQAIAYSSPVWARAGAAMMPHTTRRIANADINEARRRSERQARNAPDVTALSPVDLDGASFADAAIVEPTPSFARAPRIAMLSLHSSPLAELGAGKAGGMNVYVRELACELGRRGAHVDVFTRRTSFDETPIVSIGDNARLVSLGAGACDACDDGDALLPHVGEFVDRARDFAAGDESTYDVIHSHYWLSGVAALELRRAWSVPIVHMFHTLGAMKNRIAHEGETRGASIARLRVEAELLRTADAIVAATPRDRAQMQSFHREQICGSATGDRDQARIEVIPCGVDTTKFRLLDKHSARARLDLPVSSAGMLLFVGRIEPLKGLDTLLHALGLILARQGGEQTPTLVVVGGTDQSSDRCGVEEHRLRLLVAKLDLSAHVIFAGARPHEELPFYYSAADLLVAPSHYESFGMVALEAQACGTPVVASRVGGLTFTVEDNVTGLLAPWHDPAAFAERIERLLSDDDLRRRMGERARLQAAHCDWSQIAERVLSLYREASEGVARKPYVARAACGAS